MHAGEPAPLPCRGRSGPLDPAAGLTLGAGLRGRCAGPESCAFWGAGRGGVGGRGRGGQAGPGSAGSEAGARAAQRAGHEPWARWVGGSGTPGPQPGPHAPFPTPGRGAARAGPSGCGRPAAAPPPPRRRPPFPGRRAGGRAGVRAGVGRAAAQARLAGPGRAGRGRGSGTNNGGHVERGSVRLNFSQAAGRAPHRGPLFPSPARMTVKLGDGGGGEEGLKRLGKRSADEDSLEGEGPGSGDAAEESGGTKRDGKTPRDGGDGPQAPSGGPQAPSPPPACPQDQHHFLRSSVRPQSKRLRKDLSCAGGSSSAGSSGPRGKGTGDPSPFQGVPCAPRGWRRDPSLPASLPPPSSCSHICPAPTL